jgi:hypothetical protein
MRDFGLLPAQLPNVRGSWLCRNALAEVSMRRDFGRVALLEHFFGLDYALIAAMSG